MKNKRPIIRFIKISLFLLSGLHAYSNDNADDVSTETEKINRPAWANAFSLDTRLRFESVEQDGVESSNAFTLRNRIGWEAEKTEGISLLFEVEHTEPLDANSHDPWPSSQGTPGKAVIADPRNLELNRAQISFTNDQEDLSITVGRQRLIRNNARFIGNVGWRQNEQTYDGIVISDNAVENWSFFYSYLVRVNRIFGREAAVESQRYFDMDTHLLELHSSHFKPVNLGAYFYRLGVNNAPSQSADTFGVFMIGNQAINSTSKLDCRLELAVQQDNQKSPSTSDFNLDYHHINLGYVSNQWRFEGGWEVLTGDGDRGFSTPLATLHAFNGWSDKFLTTPVDGLNDVYLAISSKWSKNVSSKLLIHEFSAERGSMNYGREIDFVTSWKFNNKIRATLKLAEYSGKSDAPGSLPNDTRKVWIQLDMKF